MAATAEIDPEEREVFAWLAERGGLVSTSDLARRWGVSRQHVHKLASEPSFPEPSYFVGRQPLWLAAKADDWHEHRAQRRLMHRVALFLEESPDAADLLRRCGAGFDD